MTLMATSFSKPASPLRVREVDVGHAAGAERRDDLPAADIAPGPRFSPRSSPVARPGGRVGVPARNLRLLTFRRCAARRHGAPGYSLPSRGHRADEDEHKPSGAPPAPPRATGIGLPCRRGRKRDELRVRTRCSGSRLGLASAAGGADRGRLPASSSRPVRPCGGELRGFAGRSESGRRTQSRNTVSPCARWDRLGVRPGPLVRGCDSPAGSVAGARRGLVRGPHRARRQDHEQSAATVVGRRCLA